MVATKEKPQKAVRPQLDAETLARVGKELAARPVGFFTIDGVSAALEADWYIVKAILQMNPDRFEEVGRGHWRCRNENESA